MKSRLFVVDSASYANTVSTGIASIIVPSLTGQYWLKTVADIMADMLQIEIGDYIFLWEEKSGNQKSRIHGVYRAISKPYYYCNSSKDDAPFKIHIEKAFDFTNPVDEYDVLNNPYIKNSMWTIIGKKVAGKSRGSTPLSMEETNNLFKLLISKNPKYTFYDYNPDHIIPVMQPLQISYAIYGPTKSQTRQTLNPNALAYFDSKYNVKYEKILETIFNQELTNKNASFFKPLGINVDMVMWYSNYLPYSIERSEMDYVVMESDDNNTVTKISLIEFIKDSIDETHIQRACLYSKWLNETQGLGGKISRPIIVCKESPDFINGETDGRKKPRLNRLTQVISTAEKENDTNPLEVYVYSINAAGVTFTKKR